MPFNIGTAPCSWGVEFSSDPENPPWRLVLREAAEAGYRGIELGPIGFMPEDPGVLSEALEACQLQLTGGAIFQPFHDGNRWSELLDCSRRTCEALVAHGAAHLVLVDATSSERLRTIGRPEIAKQLDHVDWGAFVERFRTIAKMGTEEYGLTVSVHAHAGGFMDFENELTRLLVEIDESLLKLCIDTGHQTYAGFDIVKFMKNNLKRISYVHLKDIDSNVRSGAIEKRLSFYEACTAGIFCNLGQGAVDFMAVREVLLEANYGGWCVVEQDIDKQKCSSPLNDAVANIAYLNSIGFH